MSTKVTDELAPHLAADVPVGADVLEHGTDTYSLVATARLPSRCRT